MNNELPRPCPGCKSSRSRPQGHKNGFEIFVCQECASIFTDRVPGFEEAENYDEYYSESNLSVPPFIVDRVHEIIGDFVTYKSSNRLLDIGFGAGTILEVAKARGWDAHGQEVSAGAVRQAKEKGFEVFHGDLTAANYPGEYFDVITCSEIIEHVPNPQELMNEIARILRKGGMLWATTPSANSLSFRLLKTEWSILSPPEHTQLYSRKGISEMLRSAGFSDIRIKTAGLNPVEIVQFYRSKLGVKDAKIEGFDRVQAGYELNEKLMQSSVKRKIKGAMNTALSILGIGDSIKIYATR